MSINQLIAPVKKKFYELCDQSRINQLYAFGSSVRGDFEKESDLDFLVVLDEKPSLDRGRRLWNFWNRLEELFGRKVDLLTERQLSNKYLKKSIDRSKMLVYDRKLSKISS